MRSLIVTLALLLGILASAGTARAGVQCSVETDAAGGTYSSLQDAVDAAPEGDRLWVTGTCIGTTTIARSLRIVGLGGATLDGAASGSVITTGDGVSLTLRDLTVTNGRWGFGGGVRVGGSGRLILRGTTEVTGNVGQYGGGIWALHGVVRLNASSSVSQNTGPADGSGQGAGILAQKVVVGGSASVSDNAVFGTGGGIRASVVTLNDDATVSGNTSVYPPIVDPRSEGGGIWGNRVTLNDSSSVVDNSSEQNGGGIFAIDPLSGDGVVHLRDRSVVSGNSTIELGGGVLAASLFMGGSSAIEGNEAISGLGGGAFITSGARLAGRSSVIDNTAGQYGGGLRMDGRAKLYISSDSVAISPNSPNDPPPALPA
jgi:hypothetical protein